MKSPANLRYITLAQIVGCCLVILGHSFPFIIAYPTGGYKFISFLYAFHMPLFVWCSGFLFAYTCQSKCKSFGMYVKRRSIKLLVPYFVLSLVGLAPKIMAASLLNDTLELNGLQIVRAFLVPREGVWGHFWFLPMIYLCGVMGYVIDKIAKQSLGGWGGITIIAFVLSFLNSGVLAWLGINDLLHYFMFYSLGVFCGYIKMPIVNKYMSICIIAVCFTISLILFFCIYDTTYILHLRNTLIAMCMICVIVHFCLIIENYIGVERNSPIAQTYQIFILSWPCQLIVGIMIERILHLSWMIFIPTVFVAGITMPLMILKVVNFIENKTNNKILSSILGR